jgi:hypothetical protein
MNEILFSVVVTLVFLLASCNAYRYSAEIAESDLRQHMLMLASDDMEGRYPGSPGDAAAGKFLEQQFRRLGLSPVQQNFTFVQSYYKGSENRLQVMDQVIPDTLFTPLVFTADTLITAPVVFAGYGIQAEADSFAWNDYEGLAVSGKWVLVLRGIPDLHEFRDLMSMGSDDRDKAMLARDNGASGIIFVSGSQWDPADNLTEISGKQASVGIAAIQISRTVADRLLQSDGTSVGKLEEAFLINKRPGGKPLTGQVSARTDLETITGSTSNWFAVIEGADPLLKNDYVVVGAHYDHLGMGGPGSSSRRPDTLAVHNGADDNASGVSALLEIAGKLKKNQHQLKLSVLLIAFGAEEMGLLGSKYFVNHPPVPLEQMEAMINLDMVGRLDTTRGIQIGGSGTSLEADSLIRQTNLGTPFKLTLNREGNGPSDHSSFYGRNIPVFFISTGAHADYHTPDDDLDRINYPGMEAVAAFAYRLVLSVNQEADGLVFQEAGPRDAPTASARFKVTLGFMPDFSATDVEGVKVDFVSRGKAAERGGIKNGDIITAIDGMAITNIYDYMYRLSKLSKNQIISVELLRNGKKEVLIIQL